MRAVKNLAILILFFVILTTTSKAANIPYQLIRDPAQKSFPAKVYNSITSLVKKSIVNKTLIYEKKSRTFGLVVRKHFKKRFTGEEILFEIEALKLSSSQFAALLNKMINSGQLKLASAVNLEKDLSFYRISSIFSDQDYNDYNSCIVFKDGKAFKAFVMKDRDIVTRNICLERIVNQEL